MALESGLSTEAFEGLSAEELLSLFFEEASEYKKLSSELKRRAFIFIKAIFKEAGLLHDLKAESPNDINIVGKELPRLSFEFRVYNERNYYLGLCNMITEALSRKRSAGTCGTVFGDRIAIRDINPTHQLIELSSQNIKAVATSTTPTRDLAENLKSLYDSQNRIAHPLRPRISLVLSKFKDFKGDGRFEFSLLSPRLVIKKKLINLGFQDPGGAAERRLRSLQFDARTIPEIVSVKLVEERNKGYFPSYEREILIEFDPTNLRPTQDESSPVVTGIIEDDPTPGLNDKEIVSLEVIGPNELRTLRDKLSVRRALLERLPPDDKAQQLLLDVERVRSDIDRLLKK